MNAKIFTPVVTIFDEAGKIDYQGNKKVIEFLIAEGVDGLVPLGSTGEFTALTLQEKKDFIKFYVEQVAGRVAIIPGTSSLDLAETIELTNFAHDLGVKGSLILPPFYFAISQEEAFHYYDTIAKQVKGNIYIYNFKDRTGYDMAPEIALRLAKENKNIVGMKDSTSNVAHTKAVIATVTAELPYFEVYSGFDDHFLPNVMAGGAGCIAAISNFRPGLWADWVRAYNDGNFSCVVDISRKIDKLMALYSVQANFSLTFKEIMKNNGLAINTETIFPFENIDEKLLAQALTYEKNI